MMVMMMMMKEMMDCRDERKRKEIWRLVSFSPGKLLISDYSFLLLLLHLHLLLFLDHQHHHHHFPPLGHCLSVVPDRSFPRRHLPPSYPWGNHLSIHHLPKHHHHHLLLLLVLLWFGCGRWNHQRIFGSRRWCAVVCGSSGLELGRNGSESGKPQHACRPGAPDS